MRPDPRIRQNLDHLSSAFESATDTAATSCFTFTTSYIQPCLAFMTDVLCVPAPRPHRRRDSVRHQQANPDYPFGFYDYYAAEYSDDDDSRGGLFGWGTGELDRLLAGSGSSTGPHARPRMHYGAVQHVSRKNTLDANTPDPTVIPSTSMFGFLSAFGVRGRGMRYKPSAANLQEHPTQRGALETAIAGIGRQRSSTMSSGGDDSLRSRGDLWPSEDEDDAVVIGDDAFPRSSDGDSHSHTFASDADENVPPSERASVHTSERRRRRRKEQRRRTAVTMQRGLSERKASVAITSPPSGFYNSNSAPPTIVSASPEPYMVERFGTSPFAVVVRSAGTSVRSGLGGEKDVVSDDDGVESERGVLGGRGRKKGKRPSQRVASPPPETSLLADHDAFSNDAGGGGGGDGETGRD